MIGSGSVGIVGSVGTHDHHTFAQCLCAGCQWFVNEQAWIATNTCHTWSVGIPIQVLAELGGIWHRSGHFQSLCAVLASQKLQPRQSIRLLCTASSDISLPQMSALLHFLGRIAFHRI
jgi:hypothetical protein